MGDETFESVVQKLADLDVQYLNLHRAWRKEKADRIRMENTLKNIQELIDGNNHTPLLEDIYRAVNRGLGVGE
ncbi:MAG: hypothetical protein K0S25_26 [Bacillus sp. (in: firmicutes)]|jgi:3-keto-L-gulonate-6-phosphate decarboxylase|nr:hypothetical protein [Bacillus sp. (in: firmicutes)]